MDYNTSLMNSTDMELDYSWLYIEDYMYIVVLILTGLVGIILNIYFLKRSRKRIHKQDKIGDITLLVSILALFNILYLLGVFPTAASVILGEFAMTPESSVFCYLYKYYIHFAKFGVYYFWISISKECLILTINCDEKSNRFQMLSEALLIWLLHIVILGAVENLFPLRKMIPTCLVSGHLSVYREPVIFLIVLANITYAIVIGCKAKSSNITLDNPNNIAIVHTITQTRRIVALYSLCWIPYFLFSVGTISGLISYYLNYRVIWSIQLALNWIDMFSSALFPFVWKIRKEILFAHELM